MADPTAVDAASMIDRIASQAMGVEPQAAPAAPEGAAPAPQPAPTPQPTEAKPTEQEKAAEDGSPKTEGDKMDADPVTYEVDFNGQKRTLTPEQIKGTYERYSAMNMRNAALKPVMDLVEDALRANPNMTPTEMRKNLETLMKAQEHNPQMGNQQKQGDKSETAQAQSPEDFEASLTKWEEDNAATLPPQYKEMMMGQSQMPQQLAQMQQQMQMLQRMMQATIGQTQGVAQAARDGMDRSQSMQVNATQQQIGNNLDRVQAALQLPDQAALDFKTFAAERGYSMEDFIDPQLTMKVMTDFKNTMNSPEMDRLRGIAQRRQSYTGSLGSTPSAGQGGQPAQAPSSFDNMVSQAMSKRL